VSSLFSKASQVWLIWPQINWNIFQGWKTLANIKVQKSKQKQALLSYEKSIAQALSDVESALSGYAEDSLSLHAYKEQVRAKNVVHELSAALLSCGLKQEQDSLLAEKDFLDAQDMYFQGKQRAMASLIALYKAVGGGWQLSYPASEETSFNTEEKK
jgi:multidrug efflux system outer membrane protein